MKIGIFGGSFNPPHKMHLELVLDLIKKAYIDKAIYVPTSIKYPKPGLASNEDRFKMLELMTENYENISVSDYEFKQDLVFTYQTLTYFKEIYQNDQIYLCLGSDLLKQVDTWKEYKYILDNFYLLTILRDGDKKEDLLNLYPDYNQNIIITEVTPVELSSTRIREAIKNNNANYLNNNIDSKVLEYIKERNLYR